MKLYELSSQYRQIQQMIDDGELSESDVVDTLDGINGEFEIKAGNIVRIIKEINAASDGIDAEIKRLQARKRSLLNHKARLREYLSENMLSTGKQKIKSGMFTISLGKPRESLVIYDQNKIPVKYIQSSEIKYTFDKEALMAAAKESTVEGVHVEVGNPVLSVR